MLDKGISYACERYSTFTIRVKVVRIFPLQRAEHRHSREHASNSVVCCDEVREDVSFRMRWLLDRLKPARPKLELCGSGENDAEG